MWKASLSKNSLPFATITFNTRNTIAEGIPHNLWWHFEKSHTTVSQKLSSFAASTGMRRSSKASLLPTPNLIDLLASRICSEHLGILYENSWGLSRLPAVKESANKTLPLCHCRQTVLISMSLSKTPPTAPWKQKLPRQQILRGHHLYTYTHILKIMPSILKPGVLFFSLAAPISPPVNVDPATTATEHLCWGIQKSTTKLQKFQELWEQTAFPIAAKPPGGFSAVGIFSCQGFFPNWQQKTHEGLGGFVIAGLVL